MRVLVAFILICLSNSSSGNEGAGRTEVSFHHSDKHTGGFGVRPTNHSKGNSTVERKWQGGTLPLIFVTGIQKGGSSSLYELMIKHPLICSGLHKEMHFFDHPENYMKGTGFYRQMYIDPKCDTKLGSRYIDATPIFHYPSTWQRIYDTYNDTPIIRDNLKFIVLLREPVAREYSWYQHTIRTDLHLGQVFSGIKTLNESYTSNATFFRKGRYLEQLQAFTKVFQRKQLMVLSSMDIFKNTARVMESIRKFVGVPKHESFLEAFPHDDHLGLMRQDGRAECITAHVPALDCWVRDAMGVYFQPYNQALYSWINETRPLADPNEPPFWPLFDDYKSNLCVNDSRKDFNKILHHDSLKKPIKHGC